MSLYPCRHELRPYDPGADPSIVPWMFIAHVAVAERPGIDSGPGFHSGLEWHFYIDKGPGTPQEIITQLRDTAYQADSSYKANGFWKDGKFCGAISFESEGTGEDEWTPSQIDAIIWLFRQANAIDDIPLIVCPAWDARGLGYHRLFAEWNSPYHSCPGDPKVWQFYNVILPGLSYIEPEPEPEEEVPSPPCIVKDSLDRDWVFFKGPRNELYARVRSDVFSLGGEVTDGISAVPGPNGTMDVYCYAPNGQLWSIHNSGSADGFNDGGGWYQVA